jgi:hypothetical protein
MRLAIPHAAKLSEASRSPFGSLVREPPFQEREHAKRAPRPRWCRQKTPANAENSSGQSRARFALYAPAEQTEAADARGEERECGGKRRRGLSGITPHCETLVRPIAGLSNG